MTPVVFVHGLWLHSSSWDAWIDLFKEHGYEAIAPEWPGVPGTVAEARADPSAGGGHGITAIADHYAGIIQALPEKPVVIGHSFGGLLDAEPARSRPRPGRRGHRPRARQGRVRAAAVGAAGRLDRPAQPGQPVANRRTVPFGLPVRVRQRAVRRGVRVAVRQVGDPVDGAAAVRGGVRQLRAALTRRRARRPDRGPLLITAGGRDHTVPAAISRSTFKLQRKAGAPTDLREFPDRGHSLTIDSGWRDVAATVLDWLSTRAGS